MKVVVLGSGTGIPDPRHHAPAFYVEAGELRLLVDCGSGAINQLLRAGGDHLGLHGILFTHTHMDHVGDLMPWLHALVIQRERLGGETRALFGPPGFERWFDQVVRHGVRLPDNFPILVAHAEGGFHLRGVKVGVLSTNHSQRMASVAYRLEWGGRAVGFSGDCDYHPELGRFFRGVDLLFLECAYPDAHKLTGHLTGSECGRVAREAGAGRVVLHHLYPVPPEEEDRLEACRGLYGGPVALAGDLMAIEL